jgi:hypothetical protein
VPSGARISVEPRAESRTGNDGSRFPARRSIARPSDHPVGESGNLRGPKSPAKIINGSPLSNWILFDRPVCAFSQPNGARPVDARRAFYSSRLENVGLFISRRRELLRETGKSEERLDPHVAPVSAQFTRGDRREECPRLTLGVRHRTTTVVPFFRRTLAAHCVARLESRAFASRGRICRGALGTRVGSPRRGTPLAGNDLSRRLSTIVGSPGGWVGKPSS